MEFSEEASLCKRYINTYFKFQGQAKNLPSWKKNLGDDINWINLNFETPCIKNELKLKFTEN